MALIPKTGTRTLKMRLVVIALYIVLTAGAVTMVYPFLLMLATSITSGADISEYRIIPRYLYDTDALFPKYAEDRYAGDVEMINQYYGTSFSKIEEVLPSASRAETPQARAEARDWYDFVASLAPRYKQAGFEGYGQAPSKLKDAYRDYCRKRFGGDITRLNKLYFEESETFETVTPPFERFKLREWEPDSSAKMREWLAFKARLPVEYVRPILVEPAYRIFLKDTVYPGVDEKDSISKLNAIWGTNYTTYQQVRLPAAAPARPGELADWTRFVREQLQFRYMRIGRGATDDYQAFLKQRYSGNLSMLNARHEAGHSSFAAIGLPASIPTGGARLTDWMDFIGKRVPVNEVTVLSTENLYRHHLLAEFGSVGAINKAFGTSYREEMDIVPPVYRADWHYVASHTSELRSDFATRNYAAVMSYIVLHGRAVLNTVIFVVAVILTHIIVNPMCAYALSRYNLKYGYKVLLFVLATMAFPAEVAMIPSFLLLKQFELLNTYWALILPTMANGYAIFLLKGFFDSLPKELYEAGIMDGATETTMFRKITIPMSKPIFAVIALQSFTGAYGAFIYAMLVCQDPKMWTIMVWLYQLQVTSPQYVIMAALTVAALPTLLVFTFAQNVIMRGIIIPSYK